MAHDHDHVHSRDVDDDDFEYEDIDIKEALGLPDALPPIRLLPLPELAAEARRAPLAGQLAALATWVGKDGREVDSDGDLSDEDQAAAVTALGITAEDFDFLWEYALGVEWLLFDPEDEDRVLPGETADDWASGDDESVFAAWSSTLAAVLGETLELYGPEPDLDAEDDDEEDDEDEDEDDTDDEFNFTGQGMAIAILLFLARREGLTGEEFSEVLWENAAGELVDEIDEEIREELAEARERWEEEYGDPARLLLDKLRTLLAITETDEAIRLTPLALAALHEQLVEAGVEIPLLPQTAAELTGAELLAMAEGISDTEFEAEASAWSAARGADPAARELLELAAQGEPGQRMLAVAAVTQIGAPAEAALRASLQVPQVRGYAKVTLLALSGIDGVTGGPADVPSDLELGPDDLAWLATDLLTLACDDEYPDPDDLAVSFREAVPLGQEVPLFEAMARSGHPDAGDVLDHLGMYHPDKQVAKAARTAAHKAASRQR
jgi:hypothetical protein